MSRASPVIQLYSTQGLEAGQVQRLLKSVQDVGVPAAAFATEFCFNVASGAPLSGDDMAKVKWCLAEGGHAISAETRLRPTGHDFVVEVGPRMNFTTAWSTNCVSVLRAAEVESVSRLERSRRFLVSSTSPLSTQEKATLISVIHDRMTEMVYPTPIVSFESGMVPKPVQSVPVLKDGRAALEEINRELGLGFDDWDYEYYLNLFVNDLKRDPTDCELFDLAQSNSEHSRHWFFGGKMVIDGQEKEESLFKIVKDTLNKNPNANNNSVIAFHDNSSSIVGARVPMLLPSYYLEKEGEPGKPCAYTQADVDMDLLLTCETHNMPTGICPFNGAETGTGGRLRDVQATGIGGSYVAGTIGYCVGALNLPHDKKPYEDPSWNYPSSMASPARILIEGSNGCSDYGNKFGEPLILGFCRSFGLRTAGGERREWIKPILFTGGFGQMDSKHRKKLDPDVGMKVVKIGGPAYRIGMGGGSASSRADGDSRSDLDFNAVQRGDAEMEQKMNRVIRACCELGERNPFVQLHDQGCGGNCNVLKEVLDPIGGQIDIREIVLGDPTMSVLEIWGAEYQESNCCLVREESLPLLKQIAQRERSCVTAVGTITGDGTCTVLDRVDGSVPVQLPLRQVLGKLPPKTFRSNRADLAPAADPPGIARALFGRQDATALPVTLDLVLSNVTVGSKRFLTNKVDRSVTGLVARQQCVGPLLTPLADCAVIAHSMLTPDGVPVRGGVTAIGEQPIKGLLSGAANARMSVGEALTNIVWAKCTALGDIKCSGNWMWASKLPGEGALMYDTALALREVMHTLGVCIDGGKDSLSMFARTDTKELVKAPGELTISLYCSCPDVTMTVTPDLKRPAPEAVLLLVQIAGPTSARTGGSVAAACFGRLGDTPADCEPQVAEALKKAFNVTQDLVGRRLISAGHDRSDGGLAAAVLEMAFAGNCGVTLDVSGAEVAGQTTLEALFHEELGLVLEVAAAQADAVAAAYTAQGVSCVRIGAPCAGDRVKIVGKSGQVGEQLVRAGDAAGQPRLRRAGARQHGGAQRPPDPRSDPQPRAPVAARGRGAPGRHRAGGGQQRRPRDGRRVPPGGLRVLGRDDDRPGQRRHRPRALPRPRLRRRLLLRRHARLRQGLGGHMPLPAEGLRAVERLLRAEGHLLPRRLQRLPAPAPPAVGALRARRRAGGRRSAAGAQRLRPVRVQVRQPARGEVEQHVVRGHGGQRPRRVVRARRGEVRVPEPRAPGTRRERGARAAALRGRPGQEHAGLPLLPQRLAWRHRWDDHQGRQAPGPDAAPGALGAEVAAALDAERVEPRGATGRAVAAALHQREAVLQLSNGLPRCPRAHASRSAASRVAHSRNPRARRGEGCAFFFSNGCVCTSRLLAQASLRLTFEIGEVLCAQCAHNLVLAAVLPWAAFLL